MLQAAFQWLLVPSNLLIALALFGGVVFALGARRVGRRLFLFAAVALLIAGLTPLGPFLLTQLESRFPQADLGITPAGIILLGGAVDTHISLARGVATTNDGGERIAATSALAMAYPTARIFLSGGAGPHEPGAQTESALARALLISLGVASQRIEMEERSLTTCENARESFNAIARSAGDRWLLVTSAYHMPRAVACFRAVGFEVSPYPVDFRTAAMGFPRSLATGLRDFDLAIHEWVGLLSYRLTGRTRELFPAP